MTHLMSESAVTEVIANIDYALLREQRLALISLAMDKTTHPDLVALADGLTCLLDGLVDAVIEDRVPHAEEALLTEETE